ncbi:MAG: 50S ribosomal protein L1 [Phycisphaerales bacterium]|nr:50S ribosomal protein L1 [Phycisphaerales bacterium]
MRIKSVRYRKQVEMLKDGRGPMPVAQAVERVKQMAAVNVDRGYKNGKRRKGADQTVDLVMSLGIDPKQADQMLRGALMLPKGTGKTQRVIAFCDASMVAAAKAAGAVEAGADELIDRVTKGWMDFDVAVAHPQLMGKVGKLGRVLGPSGKMPSPKSGTVTADVVKAVKEYSAGKVEFRNDAGGNIHMPVGRVSFAAGDLCENIDAVISHILRIRPGTAKGQFVRCACLSATYTPSVLLETG